MVEGSNEVCNELESEKRWKAMTKARADQESNDKLVRNESKTVHAREWSVAWERDTQGLLGLEIVWIQVTSRLLWSFVASNNRDVKTKAVTKQTSTYATNFILVWGL